MIDAAVIGFGYWGPNWARVLRESSYFNVVAVADPRKESRDRAGMLGYPTMTAAEAANRAEAVVICTPLDTHYDLAMTALTRGCHVIVAKPLVSTTAEVAELADEAAHNSRILMVDHTFVYTGAVRKMNELVGSRQVGMPRYIDSVRVNLGLFRSDHDVVWDLAPHDLSIWDALLDGQVPVEVSCHGAAPVRGEALELAYLTCRYPIGEVVAHAHLNWLSPTKLRRMVVGCDYRMIVYDDIEPTEKVKVYDSAVTADDDSPDRRVRVQYRLGDVTAPVLSVEEALACEARHFHDCIVNHDEPLTGSAHAARIAVVLEAATTSALNNGAWTQPKKETR